MPNSRRVMVLGHQAGYLVDLEYFLRKIGYEVLGLRAGSAGVHGIREFRPRVVFAETTLGDIDAYGLCARVKTDPVLRDTTFVFMTERGMDEVHERGSAAGGEFFMQVPADPSDVGVDLYMLFAANFQIEADPPPMLRTFHRIPKRAAANSGHPWLPIQHNPDNDAVVITKSTPMEKVLASVEVLNPAAHAPHPPKVVPVQNAEESEDMSEVHNLLLALTSSFKDTFKRLEAVIQYIELTTEKKDGEVWENR